MRRLVLLTVTIAVLVSSALAQVEKAVLVGSVRDPSGLAIANVLVRISNEGTNVAMEARTDTAGDYAVPNLAPGVYTVSAEHPGMNRSVFHRLTLEVGQTARLDITMKPGALEQTIEVTAAAPLLQTENASVGQVISPAPIAALPLNGRNFVQLAILAPGVTGLDYAQTGTLDGGSRADELRPGGTTVEANGARSSSNQVLYDGIDDTELQAYTFIARPTVEGIQEFRVITNNAGAEYGHAGGAVIVLSTKSGTNQFHGSAFEFLRNSSMDAKNFFDRPTAPIPPYRLNQFGGSAGGPMVLPHYNGHNRTFFFSDYEDEMERLSQTQLVTVPTAAMRLGDFNGAAAPKGIFDPLTTRQSGSGYVRDRFPNDQVPVSRFDPIAAQLVNLYPLPQTSGLANNYVANPKKVSNLERGDFRLDHQVSSRNNLFGRYSIDQATMVIPDTFNKDIGGSQTSFSGIDDVRGQNAVIADTHTLGSNVILDFRLGFTEFTKFLLSTNLTNPVWKEIPGRNNADPFQPTAPIINPSGYAGLGNARSDPMIRRDHTFEYIGGVSWLRGPHSFKFGADVRQRLTSQTALVPGENGFGRFNFDSSFTNNPAAPAGTGNAIATMLQGYPALTTRIFFIPQIAHVLMDEYNFYARDEWRVSRKLTLNLGVHYEINTPPRERNDYWANFDVSSGALLLAGKGASSTGNVRTDYSSIGPRAGFALQVGEKTVVRGGYGMFFDPQTSGTNLRQFVQVPFSFTININPGSLFPQNRVQAGLPTQADSPPIDPSHPFGVLKGTAFDYRNLSMQQFNFGVQRQITGTSSVTVSYVGSLGRHIGLTLPVDDPPPGPGAIQSRRPYNTRYPDVTGISYLETGANSAFNSLQTSFEKRFSRGLSFGANWTWGHSLDNASDDGGADGTVPQNPLNRRADWASSTSDIRHRLNFFGSYELPFRGPLAGGWELSGLSVLQTGHPFSVSVTGSPTNTGRASRADVVPGVNPIPQNQTLAEWFDPAAFAFPQSYNWGNSGRNLLTGPRAFNVDLNLAKKIKFKESRYVMFRAEAFNMLNHPQFIIPASTLGSAGVGSITSTARQARQIQLLVKLVF